MTSLLSKRVHLHQGRHLEEALAKADQGGSFRIDQSREKSRDHRRRPRRSRSGDRRDSRSRSGSQEIRNDGTSLYVSNLSHKVGRRDLESIFKKFGEILETTIVKEPFTK